jgi:hypothetical protein
VFWLRRLFSGRAKAKNAALPDFTLSEAKRKQMTDAVNFVMLVAASIGSMVFGVLSAYGVLRVGFALMRPRRQAVLVKAPAQEARV